MPTFDRVEVLLGKQNANYLALASFVLLVYEYALTFEDEVRVHP